MEIRPPKGVFTHEEARLWSVPNRWILAKDLGGVWFQAILAVALYMAFPTAGVYLLAIALIGGAQHACGVIAHEGAHYLLVPGNRALNDRLTAWLFASPVCLPFSTYRGRHMDHHRYVSTEDDTKELYRRSLRDWRFVLEVTKSLMGFDFFAQIGSTLRTNRKNAAMAQTPNRRISNFFGDIASVAFSQALLLALFSLVDWRLYIALWIVPLITFAQLFSKFRSAAEHHPFDSEIPVEHGPYFKGTSTPHLRSLEATPIECLFLSRLNFHYHAEHHLWPQICYQYLPVISHRLRQREDFQGIVYEGSYTSVLWKFVKGL